MNAKAAVSAIAAISFATGGFAFAQNHGDRSDSGRNEQAQLGSRPDRRDNHARQQVRREDQRRAHYDDRRGERGAGPNHEFHRGARLSREYRNRQYVVDDWHGHHLHAPPRGYHWVQTGGDYVLVGIATGIILDVLLNN